MSNSMESRYKVIRDIEVKVYIEKHWILTYFGILMVYDISMFEMFEMATFDCTCMVGIHYIVLVWFEGLKTAKAREYVGTSLNIAYNDRCTKTMCTWTSIKLQLSRTNHTAWNETSLILKSIYELTICSKIKIIC